MAQTSAKACWRYFAVLLLPIIHCATIPQEFKNTTDIQEKKNDLKELVTLLKAEVQTLSNALENQRDNFLLNKGQFYVSYHQNTVNAECALPKIPNYGNSATEFKFSSSKSYLKTNAGTTSSFSFKSRAMNFILYWQSYIRSNEYFTLYVSNGQMVLQYYLQRIGSDKRVVVSDLDEDSWHNIKITYSNRYYNILIDGELTQLHSDNYQGTTAYIGGIPDNLTIAQKFDFVGFTGLIRIPEDHISKWIPVGVHPAIDERLTESGYFFTQGTDAISVVELGGNATRLSATVRPRVTTAPLLRAVAGSFKLEVALVDGSLQAVVKGPKLVSTTTFVPAEPKYLCNDFSHHIEVYVDEEELSLKVDGITSDTARLTDPLPFRGYKLKVGGCAGTTQNSCFIGCISDLSLNGEVLEPHGATGGELQNVCPLV